MFVKNINYLIEKCSYTPDSIAKSLGVSETLFSGLIAGNIAVSLGVGLKLSEFFNVPLDSLCRRDLAADDLLESRKKRLLDAADLLSAESHEKLLQEAEDMISFAPDISKDDDRYKKAVEIANRYLNGELKVIGTQLEL